MDLSFDITSYVCEVIFNPFVKLVPGTFCDETSVILSTILLPVKSPIAFSVFSISLFKAVHQSQFFFPIKTFLILFTAQIFAYNFANIFTHIYRKR